MKHVVLIHGALSTKHSFAFIRSRLDAEPDGQLRNATYDTFSYDIKAEQADSIVDRLSEKLWKVPIDRQLYLIGHSYGGVVAVAAARKLAYGPVGGRPPHSIITMGTPFGGSGVASMMQVLKPNSIFFQNIGSYGQFMKRFGQAPLPCRTRSIITTEGAADFLVGPNDGVVTVESQQHFKNDPLAANIQVKTNHFEVLLSKEVVDLVKKELFR